MDEVRDKVAKGTSPPCFAKHILEQQEKLGMSDLEVAYTAGSGAVSGDVSIRDDGWPVLHLRVAIITVPPFLAVAMAGAAPRIREYVNTCRRVGMAVFSFTPAAVTTAGDDCEMDRT